MGDTAYLLGNVVSTCREYGRRAQVCVMVKVAVR